MNVATRLTAAGRGAIATLLASGDQATAIVERLFISPGSHVRSLGVIGGIRVGRWLHERGEEVVVCQRSAQTVEINCHGGEAAVAAILASLEAAGCTIIDWREWLRRGSASRIAVEAAEDLAGASTMRTSLVLLDQLRGALERALLEIGAAIEHGDASTAKQQISELVARSTVGRHLTEPFRVVLCGRPNVGKSSLLNRLLGHERAIVAATPGTTRDIVTAATALDGWPIELSDTAGWRETAHPIEREGVARSERQLAQADLAVVVLDIVDDPAGVRIPDLAGEALFVRNKSDLLARGARRDTAELYISALTGEGIEQLTTAVVSVLVPEAPPRGAAVPFRPEHSVALSELDDLLSRACWHEARTLVESLVGRPGSL